MKRVVLFVFAFLALCACAKTTEFFRSAIESRHVFGIDGVKYEVRDGGRAEASVSVPAVRLLSASKDLPDGAAISMDGFYVQNNYTNVNGTVYQRVLVDFSCNFDWRGWHPYIQRLSFSGLDTIRTRLEWQDESVYLGDGNRAAIPSLAAAHTSYAYGWHGYAIGYAPADVKYFGVSVDTEPYDEPEDEYYLVTPTGEDAARKMQYVMIDQRGEIWPSNAVATVAQAAATATRLAAAEVAAVAYTNAEAQTQAAVDDLAAAIIAGAVVIYEDDFMYSLGDAVAISTNCLCRIYDFKAKVEQVTVDGVECERSWVYFGFTENIGSLSPVAQFKDSLSADIDWGEITCGTPEAQDHSFTANGESYDYCYRMSVDIPRTYSSAFLRVYTEITSQVGDGSVLDISGGIAGGLTATVRFGETAVEFVGGLAVEPEKD